MIANWHLTQIAVDNFIDNIATLGVEKCVLDDMPGIMSPEMVWTLSDEDVAKVAAEDEEAKSRRHKLRAQVLALEETIRICKRQARTRHVDGQYARCFRSWADN